MKFRSLVVMFLLAAMPLAAAARDAHATAQNANTAPAVERVLAAYTDSSAAEVSNLVMTTAEIPLGPPDLLQGYENEMTLISQKTAATLDNISMAARSGQITPSQAEYLIQERYQVAMMQYQVLSALHDALEQSVARAAGKSASAAAASGTAVVVQPPFRTARQVSR